MTIFGLVTQISVKRESPSLASLRCLSFWLEREREKVHGLNILLRFRWSGPAMSRHLLQLGLCNYATELTHDSAIYSDINTLIQFNSIVILLSVFCVMVCAFYLVCILCIFG